VERLSNDTKKLLCFSQILFVRLMTENCQSGKIRNIGVKKKGGALWHEQKIVAEGGSGIQTDTDALEEKAVSLAASEIGQVRGYF